MRQIKITPTITNRDSQSLDKYLNDISKIGMVTIKEEVRLTRLIFCLFDGLTTDDALIKESISATVGDALKNLPERERSILILFYGIGLPQPCTLEEIGVRYGLTRERVRQLRDKALQHLRLYARKHELIKFLEA